MKDILIENRLIGKNHPTYFIADIAANHDGDIERAKNLIYLCAEAGADAAKFQHFNAKTIVSDYGFKSLGKQLSHQSNWKKSVFDVYKDASLNPDWTPILKQTCEDAGITFLTSPYSFELIDKVDNFLSAYKIGSGDITWLGIIEYIASKNKPIILATGASTQKEVDLAIYTLKRQNSKIILMQCNTNYTASLKNFRYINLNVLNEYKRKFPDIILGLSDHTPGHSTVLGAVSLGARAIEKHFTDDTSREGPDHKFSMNFKTWKEMVDRTRELELSLGTEIKRVEENEQQTVILQRRAIRVKKDLAVGHVLVENDLEFLRPCPLDAIPPYEFNRILGKKIATNIKSGEYIKWKSIK
tara:strand:+ start:996 stop:2063 length:1068 start_codon:yes stop_codon:yes gene_type:complete